MTTQTNNAPRLTADEITSYARDLAACLDRSHTVDLDDAWQLRAWAEPDDYQDIRDDCLGRVEPAEQCQHSNHYKRPAWADGSAELLRVGRGHDAWWWLPYREGRKVYNGAEDRRLVVELLEEGYSCLVVELCHGSDYYGCPVVVAASSLGGIHPADTRPTADDGFLVDTITELIRECLGDAAA